MPGISGIIAKTKSRSGEDVLRSMVDCMLHEPFYTSGTYINPQMGLYLGWVCHQNSFSDCMPVWNEKKDVVLIFFGEDFSHKGVKDRLKRNHHECEYSDASYIVHLYEEKGCRFLEDLNGWFHGILVDIKKREALLFNDRYGMQRIYYHETRDSFYFSSEAKSLLRVCPELRSVDPRGLGEFFHCNCVLENRTLFSKIYLLPGAAAWTFRNGGIAARNHYFSPRAWESQAILNEGDFYNELKRVFVGIIPRYLRAKDRIGISLTGGLDTRMIMAGIGTLHTEFPCYTFGGMYRDSYDVRVARSVARLCRQPHHVLRLGGNFLSKFPAYAEKTVYLTDGCLDVSGSPELYINSLARSIAPIRMTGNYGSEVLRDIRNINANRLDGNIYTPDFSGQVESAAATLSRINKGHSLSLALFQEAPWHDYGRFSLEQSQLTPRTPFTDNDFVRQTYQAPPGVRNSNRISLQLIQDCNRSLSSIRTDRGVGGTSYGPLSFLSQAYCEATFKGEYYFSYGMPHWLSSITRRLRPLNIERLFLGRHKFHHFRVWYRDELAPYLRDVLLDKRSLGRPYLNGPFTERMIRDHIDGRRNYTSEISKVLTVELVHRLLIEGKG